MHQCQTSTKLWQHPYAWNFSCFTCVGCTHHAGPFTDLDRVKPIVLSGRGRKRIQSIQSIQVGGPQWFCSRWNAFHSKYKDRAMTSLSWAESHQNKQKFYLQTNVCWVQPIQLTPHPDRVLWNRDSWKHCVISSLFTTNIFTRENTVIYWLNCFQWKQSLQINSMWIWQRMNFFPDKKQKAQKTWNA